MQGRVLGGRYRLLSPLGQGGMGSVWRAQQLDLPRPVAIKVIHPGEAGATRNRVRFEREARAAAELTSLHIVDITDYGIDNDTPYIVMKLLEGESLAARLSRRGKLPFEETVCLLSQVAKALTCAHQMQTVHGHLCPENVFIAGYQPEKEGSSSPEVVKVLPFFFVRDMTEGLTPAMAGDRLCYLSPEQLRGSTDWRTDIWSFGIIAYRCVTGHLPCESNDSSVFFAMLMGALPQPSTVAPVPYGFDEWFARATARDKTARFQTVAEAAAALATIVADNLGHSVSPAGAGASLFINRTDVSPDPDQTDPRAGFVVANRALRSLWIFGFIGLVVVVISSVVVLTNPSDDVAPCSFTSSASNDVVPSEVSGPQANLHLDLDRAYRMLTDGKIAYPDSIKMHQGDESTVSVRVSPSLEAPSTSGMAGTVKVEELKYSKVTEACLLGSPDQFEIRPLNGRVGESPDRTTCTRQAIVGDIAEWNWVVRPIESGRLKLRLSIAAVLVVTGGTEFPKYLPVKHATVDVTANRLWSAERLCREHWEWVIGAAGAVVALVKVGLWEVNRRSKQQAPNLPSQSTSKPPRQRKRRR